MDWLEVAEGQALWVAILTVDQVELVVSRTTASHATPPQRLEFEEAVDHLLASITFERN
jgi:hypothetical protein